MRRMGHHNIVIHKSHIKQQSNSAFALAPAFSIAYHINPLRYWQLKTSQNALDNIYNPFGFSILPVEEDPFYLFTDFLTELGQAGIAGTINGKYYEVINLKVDDNLALSPSLMNKEVAKLIKLQKLYNNKELNTYLTGAPVHAYYASESSMNEINLICIISTMSTL